MTHHRIAPRNRRHRTVRTLLGAGALAGAAVLAVAGPAAASNDWHRVSTKTFNNFCVDHHHRDTPASWVWFNDSLTKTVGGASATVCWGGGHVGVQTESSDDAADGRGVRAQIRYRVAVNGHWSGYHYRALSVNRGGKGTIVTSHTYSASRGMKGVVVRVQIFDKAGHITAYGAWE